MGRRARRKFSAEYKAEVVELCRTSGKSIGRIAKEMELTETCVREWVRQAEVDAGRGPAGARRLRASAKMCGSESRWRRCFESTRGATEAPACTTSCTAAGDGSAASAWRD